MRNAVIAFCTILTITALCENAMAGGAAGVRARPSTGAHSHGVAITPFTRIGLLASGQGGRLAVLQGSWLG